MTTRFSVVLHAHASLALSSRLEAGEHTLFGLCEHGLLPLLAWLGERPRAAEPLLTLALSPTLLAQLAERTVQVALDVHLEARVAAAQGDVARLESAGHTYFARLAVHYRDVTLGHLERLREGYSGNLLGALIALRDEGALALVPSAGTHAVLPLIEPVGFRGLHVAAACAEFRHHFGDSPTGMWLPEGAWAPGLDQSLKAQGVEYALVAAMGLRPALGPPDLEWLPPVRTPAGVVVWPEVSSLRRAMVGPEGARLDPAFAHLPAVGLRDVLPYFARGDEEGVLPPYDVAKAARRAQELGRELGAVVVRGSSNEAAPSVLALDLASVGRLWPEGLWVLEALLASVQASGLAVGRPQVAPGRPLAEAEPMAGSCREDGYFAAWVDEDVGWVYRRLAQVGSGLWRLRRRAGSASGAWRRSYERALRELLLAQSSDWCGAILEGREVGRTVASLEVHLGRAEAGLERLAEGRDGPEGDAPERGGRLFGDLVGLLG